MKTTEAANKKVIMRAISSPSRRRLKNEREPATGPALGTMVVAVDISSNRKLSDFVESSYFLCDYFLGKLRVGERLGIVLPIRQHPFHEAFDGIAFSGIGEFRRNQEPGKAGNGVSGLSRGFRDGDAKVGGHVLCGTGGGGRYA